MLVVTTTERMLYGVLGHTTNLGPAVALDGVLVVGTSRLEQGLVGTTTSRNDANLRTDGRGDRLLSTTGQTQTRGTLVLIVRDHHGEAATASGKGTAISQLGLNVADNGSLRNDRQGKHVSDRQGSLLTAVDELTRVHAFGAHQQLIVPLVAVGVAELDLGDRSTPTRVVEDLLDDAADVSVLLGVIQGPELDRALAGADVGLEDGGFTLALCLGRGQRWFWGLQRV